MVKLLAAMEVHLIVKGIYLVWSILTVNRLMFNQSIAVRTLVPRVI